MVDTSVLVQLLLPSEEGALIEEVARLDDEWHAPALWRSELRSVLVQQVRRGALSVAAADECLIDAEQLLGVGTCDADPLHVIDLALESGCSAYDCEFVDVAVRLGAPLLTADRALLAAFGEVAVTPEQFLRLVGGG
ncbi:MAG: type II toxin-antitoxin system VapC family toxin [Planctomycetes bacterium]|nr:type II toxin-antitoxin system VapC family toxin [Planctomycetota bacterium]